MTNLLVTPEDEKRADDWATMIGRMGGVFLDQSQRRGLASQFAAHRISHSLPGDVGTALCEHFPLGLRQLYDRSAQGIDVQTYVGTECLCGWCTSATDEQEVRQQWAAHVAAALTPSSCPGDVGDEEQPGDYLRDELLNIAAICEAKALHVEAASLRSTAAIVSEQLRKGQQASAGHVKLLRGLLKEFVEAMERYQMDVDDDAPPRHRDMMERAYAALTPSALSGDAGEGE